MSTVPDRATRSSSSRKTVRKGNGRRTKNDRQANMIPLSSLVVKDDAQQYSLPTEYSTALNRLYGQESCHLFMRRVLCMESHKLTRGWTITPQYVEPILASVLYELDPITMTAEMASKMRAWGATVKDPWTNALKGSHRLDAYVVAGYAACAAVESVRGSGAKPTSLNMSRSKLTFALDKGPDTLVMQMTKLACMRMSQIVGKELIVNSPGPDGRCRVAVRYLPIGRATGVKFLIGSNASSNAYLLLGTASAVQFNGYVSADRYAVLHDALRMAVSMCIQRGWEFLSALGVHVDPSPE